MNTTRPEPVIYNEFTTASGHKLAVITLNAEASLNSLTLEMLESLLRRLSEYENDPLTAAIWLQGAGTRAFCAGGDIRKLYEAMLELKNGVDLGYPRDFFVTEYSCDYKIHNFKKPIICWGNGIVMGGGMGLFAGSAFRLVTENTKIAMPEISIGLYPDVGATWFLNRMPQGLGRFIGLTGVRLNAADALFSGLATHFVKSDLRGQILSALQNATFTMNAADNRKTIEGILEPLVKKSEPDLAHSELKAHLSFINESARFENISDLAQFWKDHLSTTDTWLKNSLATFFRGSPTSAHVIFEQLRRASELFTLKDVFCRELSMTLHFSRSHDFLEGIRALIIDKDNKPNWKPAHLQDVSEALVNHFFEDAFAPSEENPLAKLCGNL